MRIFDIVSKDIRQMLRDWRTIFFMLVMPVLFTVMFGFVFSGGGDSGEDLRLPVGYLDQDGSQLSSELKALLSASDVIRIEDDEMTRPDMEQAVLDEDLAAVVIVPAGYGEALGGGNGAPLAVLVLSGSSTAMNVQGEVQRIAGHLGSAAGTAHTSTEFLLSQGGDNSERARQAYFDASLGSALLAWSDPPVTMQVSSTGSTVTEEEQAEDVYGQNSFNHSSAGMMAQFAIAGLMGAASILVLERKDGTMKRLMTTNLRRSEYLFGHYLTMFIMVFLQLLLLSAFGHLILKVQYYREPVAVLLLITVSALFSASLGLLIGAIAKREEHVIVIALVLMFLLAGIGGAWVPLEITPESFQQIARYTPLAWMVGGFKDIVVRGLGLSAVLPALYALIGFTVVVFFAAV